jgi:multisubunit Na+/H+ antiporter MnhG subunit
MFELLVFAGVALVLIGAVGLGYPQSTYSRWNRH